MIPVLGSQVILLKNYMTEYKLIDPSANLYPLFYNSRKEKLTSAWVNYILSKYITLTKWENPKLIPNCICCHTLRHSKAVHLLQAGVNLIYIRDILVHVFVQTTEIYARADSRAKREAIEKAYTNVTPKEKPRWLTNDKLLNCRLPISIAYTKTKSTK